MLAGHVDAYGVGGDRARWQVQFPRDFGGFLLEFAEVFGVEIAHVHQDAVCYAAVGDGFPGFRDFRGEFDLAVACDVRAVRGLRATGFACGRLDPEGIEFPGESLFETERSNSQKAARLSDDLPL